MSAASPQPASQLDETGVAIVGVGLIGGSIAAALKARGFTGPVLGFGRNTERLAAARDRGLIDDFATEPTPLVGSASLVVVCTPVQRIAADVQRFAAHAAPGTLLTDAGSVKAPICRELHDLADGSDSDAPVFVGSHPMAGSEKNGFEFAQADLFDNRVCIVTPADDGVSPAVERTAQFWRFLGMRIVPMTPDEHDAGVAFASHLPHLVAAALAATLPAPYCDLAATGFRDTTRIASGDPDLWTEILSENSAAVQQATDAFLQQLAAFRQEIAQGDPAALKKLLEQAKNKRDALNSNT